MGEFWSFIFVLFWGLGMREIVFLIVREGPLGTSRGIRCVWCVVGFWDGVIGGVLIKCLGWYSKIVLLNLMWSGQFNYLETEFLMWTKF